MSLQLLDEMSPKRARLVTHALHGVKDEEQRVRLIGKLQSKTNRQIKQSIQDKRQVKRQSIQSNSKPMPVNYASLHNQICGYYMGTLKKIYYDMLIELGTYDDFKERMDNLRSEYYDKDEDDYSKADLMPLKFNDKMEAHFKEYDDILKSPESYEQHLKLIEEQFKIAEEQANKN